MCRKLNILLIFLNVSVGSTLGADLFAHWAFEDNADDETGNYDGTENTPITYSNVDSVVGKYASFTATDSNYINLGTLGNFGSSLGSATIMGWLNWNHSSNWQVPFGGYTQYDFQCDFQINRRAASGYPSDPGEVFFYLRDSDQDIFCASTNGASYNDGTWRHFAWVLNGAGNVALYVNGQSVNLTVYLNEYPNNFINYACDMYLGARSEGGNSDGAKYYGKIDEFRLYTGAMTQADIQEIYNTENEGNPYVDAGDPSWEISGSGTDMYFDGRNLGVGAGTPLDKLHIQSAFNDISVQEASGVLITHKVYNGGGGQAYLRLQVVDDGTVGGAARFTYKPTAVTNALDVIELKSETANEDIQLKVKGEVVVETDGADYVFSPDYELPSLDQIEAHIQEKKHLPDVPSADEMQEKGMGVGEMQTKLLQKVEELTLYLIEQHKRLETIEEENKTLRSTVYNLIESRQHSER